MTDAIDIEPTEELWIAALVAWLEEDDVTSDDIEVSTYDEERFELGNREWLVLTEEEADDKAKEEIENSLWAFNASFLVHYVPDGITEDILKTIQEAKYEDASEPFRAMIGDKFDEFVDDAISTDGRGHFLAGYDGDENEIEVDGIDWLIYRVN